MTDDGYVKMSDFLNDLEQTKTSNTMYEIGYKKGRTDAFTQILMYLNDASLVQSGNCYDCTRELMEIIERMEGEQND